VLRNRLSATPFGTGTSEAIVMETCAYAHCAMVRYGRSFDVPQVLGNIIRDDRYVVRWLSSKTGMGNSKLLKGRFLENLKLADQSVENKKKKVI
jgi:hypothetical protein